MLFYKGLSQNIISSDPRNNLQVEKALVNQTASGFIKSC